MEIVDKKIKNKNIKGCIICQNIELAAKVDPDLFKASMSLKTLKEKLENEGIFLDVSELRTHTRHLFYDKDECVTEEIESEIIEKATNTDMTKKLIAKVAKHIKLLETEGKGNTLEHQKLIKQQTELIELKSKLEGDLKPAEVAILPDWVRKASDEEERKIYTAKSDDSIDEE